MQTLQIGPQVHPLIEEQSFVRLSNRFFSNVLKVLLENSAKFISSRWLVEADYLLVRYKLI